MKRKKTRPKGMTFVELLIVTALLAVIALTLYSVFASGVKIWEIVNTSISEEEVNIFFSKLSQDLKNSFRFKGTDFLGKEESVAFSSIVKSQRMGIATVGQVIYAYKPSGEEIVREERDFSHIYDEDEGEITDKMSGVESAAFQYRYYSSEIEEYVWVDEWEKEALPLTVRIELELNDGRETRKFTRTIDIPCSGEL